MNFTSWASASEYRFIRVQISSREEICTLIKRYSDAEAQLVKFIKANTAKCGIPPDAAAQMNANHSRTLKSVNAVCSTAGPAKPTGPGLSEALGTTRGGRADPDR